MLGGCIPGQHAPPIKSLVARAGADGCRYNVCVFAYGQTGSGKTHTMEGPAADPGINFRTMQELFRVIDTERRASHKHSISASIVEIYNEQVLPLAALATVEHSMPAGAVTHRQAHGLRAPLRHCFQNSGQ